MGSIVIIISLVVGGCGCVLSFGKVGGHLENGISRGLVHGHAGSYRDGIALDRWWWLM